MQLPLQLPRVAWPMQVLQPIYPTWSYTLPSVLALDPFSLSSLLFLLNPSLNLHKTKRGYDGYIV
jgi:hypothetical protein